MSYGHTGSVPMLREILYEKDEEIRDLKEQLREVEHERDKLLETLERFENDS